MSKPLIGLTSYFEPAEWGLWSIEAALIPRWYLDVFQSAGADVLLIPPGTDESILDRIDGLVIAGGADVDSRLYGEEPHETADSPRESRDATEMAMYRGARERDLPFLGICRGAQIMAVADGGSLYQHLPEITDLAHKEAPLVFVEHGVRFESGSAIEAIYGTQEFTINSFHHQAIKDAGSTTVTGWATDGVIEVVEDPKARFAIGVQWHPEHPDRRQSDAPLIRAFLDVCR